MHERSRIFFYKGGYTIVYRSVQRSCSLLLSTATGSPSRSSGPRSEQSRVRFRTACTCGTSRSSPSHVFNRTAQGIPGAPPHPAGARLGNTVYRCLVVPHRATVPWDQGFTPSCDRALPSHRSRRRRRNPRSPGQSSAEATQGQNAEATQGQNAEATKATQAAHGTEGRSAPSQPSRPNATERSTEGVPTTSSAWRASSSGSRHRTRVTNTVFPSVGWS